MAMALTSSLMVNVAVASELSAATENRADFTVHSHNKKVSFLSLQNAVALYLSHVDNFKLVSSLKAFGEGNSNSFEHRHHIEMTNVNTMIADPKVIHLHWRHLSHLAREGRRL